MWSRMIAATAMICAAGMAGGCASDGDVLGGLTTSSVTPAAEQSQVAKAAPVDPQCVALMAKIDDLRKEGTPGRIEKVSAGKGTTAVVKRTALARITELDKANAEFQQRCSTLTPAQQAAAKPAPSPAEALASAAADQAKDKAQTAAKQAATKTVAKAAVKAVPSATGTTVPAAATAAAKAAAQ